MPLALHDPFSPAPSQATESSPSAKAGRLFVHHTTGSHHILKHPDNPTLRVTLPYPNKDFKLRTLESIVKQSGLTHDEFKKLF